MTDRIAQDLRLALRGLRRNPGYAAVVVLTLALGIAATTTVFSVVNPYLLRPLPYAQPDRLLQVEQVEPARGATWIRFSLPQWADWRDRTRAFDDIAAYRYNTVNLTGEAGAERVMAAFVSGNLFEVLGVGAARGRTFGMADAAPEADAVAVISHGLWASRYGADPSLVGRTVRIDGATFTVIGVTPPDFNFPWNEVRMWIPSRIDPASAPRDRQNSILIGRLAEGWTADGAREDLLRIQQELGAVYPDVDGRYTGVNVRPLREALNFAYDVIRVGLSLLLAAVAAVLLIACVNVASLLLARTTARGREMAVRQALGAGQTRLAGQLLTESALLALLGGAMGLMLAVLAIRLVGDMLPESLYRVGTASLDWRVVGFAAAVTLLTPVLFGFAPALAAARHAPGEALRGGGRDGAGRRAIRGRRALVAGQVGLAVMLAVTTLLVVRSFQAVRQIELGFRPESMLVAEVTSPQATYPDADALHAYDERALEAIRALPGVRAAGLTNPLPLNHETPSVGFAAAAADRPTEDWPRAIFSAVSPGWFDAAGIALRAGRTFTDADRDDALPVAVVSRALSEHEWPGASPVGRTLRLANDGDPLDVLVIGVVDDIRWTGLVDAPAPHVYRPLRQSPARRRFIAISVTGSPAAAAAPVRDALATLDAELPVTIRPMAAVVRENDFPWTVGSIALGTFGLAALLLASLGIYGVIAYAVARRRREIGVRVAVGATASQIRRLVVGDALRLATLGLACGLLPALAAGRVLRSLLYGVSPGDPLVFGAVIALFLVVAAAAAALPAQRAAGVEPVTVLRE